MKKLFFTFILIISFSTSAAVISIEEVAKNVSSKNFLVLENAHQTYQASESIQMARMNLLPQLNFWDVVGVVYSPSNVIGLVQDIAPFLVPANWFRVNEQKKLYKVQEYAYHSVWANQVLTAKSMFYRLLMDRSLKLAIEANEKSLRETLVIVKSKELLGGVAPGISKMLETRLLAIEEDGRALESMLIEEISVLKFILGIPVVSDVELKEIKLPDLSQFKPLNFNEFVFRATDTSPELKQYDELINVIPLIKKEIYFSILGTSSLSRGVGGGVFDDIPIQRGLGFGMGASLRILKDKEELLKLQRLGVRETLSRQLKILVDNYNLDLASHASSIKRVNLSQIIHNNLQERIMLGEDIDIMDFIESSKNLISAQTSLYSTFHRFFANEDRLQRIIFQGDYAKLPNFQQLIEASGETK